MKQSRIQQYRMRYILAKLTQYIEQQAWSNPAHDSLDQYIASTVEVEHILPQNPTNEVKEAFDKKDQYNEYLEKLGNLTLLEKTINTSVSNDLYQKKVPGYRQSSYLLTRSLAEKPKVGLNTQLNRAVEHLITFDQWNSEAIECRQGMLARLAVFVWDMPGNEKCRTIPLPNLQILKGKQAMSKIQDVVKLKSGYANFVELKSAFEAAQENADRMAMYRPTKAHRVAFERICRGLYQPNDKKFYLLSGSYGTGKSHLCLMTANVLSRSSGDPEIAGFHENYAKLDPEKAKLLKNIRKDGQYLVAICDYHSGRHFEDVVMKAVFDACKAKGLDAGVETEFDEAERQLAEWEKKGDKGGIRNFYVDFGKALEAVVPGLTVDQLRAGLKNYDSDVLGKIPNRFQGNDGRR